MESLVLLKRDCKKARSIGSLAGWFRESFVFVPRFFSATLLLTALPEELERSLRGSKA